MLANVGQFEFLTLRGPKGHSCVKSQTTFFRLLHSLFANGLKVKYSTSSFFLLQIRTMRGDIFLSFQLRRHSLGHDVIFKPYDDDFRWKNSPKSF